MNGYRVVSETEDGQHVVRTAYGTFTANTREGALHLANIAERREKQRQALERRDMATRSPYLSRRVL